MTAFRAALVQFTAARDPDPNIATVSGLVREARAGGADLVLTPENTGMLEPDDAAKLAKAEPEDDHRVLAALRDVAAETGAWLLIGSLAVKTDDPARVANRSFLVQPDGGIAARYDKIHLFDVDLSDRESYRESASVAPGERAVVAATPWGRLGMSVCYDLRFPLLYRALAQGGAEFLAIPSAFTVPTGRAHWHVLLRARAIETGCFVLAPAQTGAHAEGRTTYGHSLAVDPWGRVLADAGDVAGVAIADIDPAQVAEARRAIPSLDNARPFAPPADLGEAAAE